MPNNAAVRPRHDTVDAVASFRRVLAGVDELPPDDRASGPDFADMGFPGRDLRLFAHRGVRCRVYQRDWVEPYLGREVDPALTVSLTLADDGTGDQREYTYVVGGGAEIDDLRIRRRVSRRGDGRSSWRQLDAAEAHALLRIVGGGLPGPGGAGAAPDIVTPDIVTPDIVTRFLALITDLSPWEVEALSVPHVHSPAPPAPAPARRSLVDRWERGVGLAAGALVVALIASLVTQSASSLPQARIRILQAYEATPVAPVPTSAPPPTTAPPPTPAPPTKPPPPSAPPGTAPPVIRGRAPSPPPRVALATSPAVRIAPPSTWVAAVAGGHWPCEPDPVLIVDVDPTGATAQELGYYLTAIQEAADDTGRQMIITEAPFAASVGQAGDTIYVAWHGIAEVPPTTNLHPAWTALYVNQPPLDDGGATPEFWSADTVFSAGLPQVAYYHETGREFGLGNSPYPTDDGYGGNFAAARLPPHQDFSRGDIAGLRAGAPSC